MTLIIDCHGHYTTAPAAHNDWRDLQKAAFKAGEAAPAYPSISDDEIRETLEKNQIRLLKERGADITIFSPRASAMAPHVGDESVAKQWARGYSGRAFASGALKKLEVPHGNGAGMQGFAMNLRRPLFTDRRVRQALVLAFDFDWANRQLFYRQYTRSDSYFSNSELAGVGQKRVACRVTQQQVADAASLTIGFISQGVVKVLSTSSGRPASCAMALTVGMSSTSSPGLPSVSPNSSLVSGRTAARQPSMSPGLTKVVAMPKRASV